jgi:hypothetical protein
LGKMVKLKLKPGWEFKVKSVTSVSQFLIKFQDIITCFELCSPRADHKKLMGLKKFLGSPIYIYIYYPRPYTLTLCTSKNIGGARGTSSMFTIGVNMLTTKLIYYLSHKIICWQHTLCNPCITKWLCLQHTWCIYVAKQTLQIGGTYKSGSYLFLGSLTFVKSLKFEVQFYYKKSLKKH